MPAASVYDGPVCGPDPSTDRSRYPLAMNNNKPIALALFFGILIGCASTQVTQIATVGAQTAGPGQFTECVARTIGYDGDHGDLPENANSIAGWTPVGGAGMGNNNSLFVILCR